MKTKLLLLRGLAAIALFGVGLFHTGERLNPAVDQHSISTSADAIRICDDETPWTPPGGGDDPASARVTIVA